MFVYSATSSPSYGNNIFLPAFHCLLLAAMPSFITFWAYCSSLPRLLPPLRFVIGVLIPVVYFAYAYITPRCWLPLLFRAISLGYRRLFRLAMPADARWKSFGYWVIAIVIDFHLLAFLLILFLHFHFRPPRFFSHCPALRQILLSGWFQPLVCDDIAYVTLMPYWHMPC